MDTTSLDIFTLPDLGIPGQFLISWGILFVIIYLRYLFISGGFTILIRLKKKQWQRRLLHDKFERSQVLKEMGWSALTSLLFSFTGIVFLLLWQMGNTAMVMATGTHSATFYVFTFFIALFIQETFYYWAHRWMHQPKIYRLVHEVLHDSHSSNSFTAFSFHPLESILQAIPLLLTLVILPMHVYGVIGLLLVMTVSATINHGSLEIFPKGAAGHWLGKWFIGATHHHLHHRQFRYNFGLYFTFWDRWMGTESPQYGEQMLNHD